MKQTVLKCTDYREFDQIDYIFMKYRLSISKSQEGNEHKIIWSG